MTTAHLSFHPEAIAEARVARQWYADRDLALAAAFIAEVDLAVEQITEHRHTWPPYEKGTRRYLARRFPYFVVYRELGERIDVVAVMHAKRTPGYWHQPQVRIHGS